MLFDNHISLLMGFIGELYPPGLFRHNLLFREFGFNHLCHHLVQLFPVTGIDGCHFQIMFLILSQNFPDPHLEHVRQVEHGIVPANVVYFLQISRRIMVSIEQAIKI